MTEIIFATHNQKKVFEVSTYLNPLDYEVISLAALKNFEPVEENGETFYDNALIKAESCFIKYQKPSMADDSGLIVPILNGEPGVRSARYAGENASDEENMNRLIAKIEEIDIQEIPAYFETVIVILLSKEEILFGRGRCMGHLIKEPRGTYGFGYDPIFIPDQDNPQSLTFAQMRVEEKNKISHRTQALKEVIEKLSKIKKY